MKARSSKDEYTYDQQLREQEAIKTEVINDLREQNRVLLLTQENLLRNLINAESALAGYRRNTLAATERANAKANASHCTTDCARHSWDTVAGWKKNDGDPK